MAAPSKQRAYSPYPANTLHRSFPPQYHTSYTSQYHTSTPTSAPTISPPPPSYDGHAKLRKLSPDVFGTYTSPSPHDLPLFNTELHAHQLSLQEKNLSYRHSSSPSSSEGETYGSSSPTHTPFPPSSTPTTPSSQTPQHHACHSTSRQPWASPNQTAESSYPCTPTAFTGYNESTPVTFTTTSPSTNTPILINSGERQREYYIGTPSTPPPPLYPHVSSPDLTTPTSAARARYIDAQNIPLTPLYFHVSSPVMASPMSEGSEFGGVLVHEPENKEASEFGGALVHEPENKEASEEVWRLMADREGRSRFPGSMGGWGGFETGVEGKRMMSGGGGDELVSPRNTAHGFESQYPVGERRITPGQAADELVSPRTNSHGFETQETPLLAGTPAPLAQAYLLLASPHIRQTYSNANAYHHFAPPRNTTHGFEAQSPAAEKRTTPGQAVDELGSPRSNTHGFQTQETPLLAGTPTPLGPAYSSPLTSPPVRRTYSNANAYRNFVPPPGPSSPLPPAPHLPLPEPRYSEHYSINPCDADVARANQLLEEHMKNRWGSVLSANNALQSITGTAGLGSVSPSKASVETAAATLTHIRTGVPRPRPLLPGFNTPMQSMQRMHAERAGRVRSLRAIYDEYVTLPHARAVDLCSLSIHAVSGSFGSGSASNSSQPAKLQNELLGHFTATEGATALQLLEIDMPNPTGGYNAHPFERWAFFVIALPIVCGAGGADRGYVGGHERASMVIAAPLGEVVVDGGREAQDVLGDGRGCLRRDFVFGAGVGWRMEFWEKYGRWGGVGERVVGGGEWLCAEVEGQEGRMEEWEVGYAGFVLEGVRRDVERWRRVRRAMEEGVCRVVTRVVDEEGERRKERARERRAEREGEGEGGLGDWEREGVRAVEGGSSVKKRRRGR